MLYFNDYKPINSRIFDFNGKRYLYRELSGYKGDVKVFGQVPDDFTFEHLKAEDMKDYARRELGENTSASYVPDRSLVHETVKDINLKTHKSEFLGTRVYELKEGVFNTPQKRLFSNVGKSWYGGETIDYFIGDKNIDHVRISTYGAPLEPGIVKNISTKQFDECSVLHNCTGYDKYDYIADVKIECSNFKDLKGKHLTLEEIFKNGKRLLNRYKNALNHIR